MFPLSLSTKEGNMSKPIITTADTFEIIRNAINSDLVTISKKMWLRKIYAFAAKNKALTQKQAEVACDICLNTDKYLWETFVNLNDFKDQYFQKDSKNEMV